MFELTALFLQNVIQYNKSTPGNVKYLFVEYPYKFNRTIADTFMRAKSNFTQQLLCENHSGTYFNAIVQCAHAYSMYYTLELHKVQPFNCVRFFK